MRSPGARAFLASFAVYLTPLVGPHAFWLLGGSLLRELVERGPQRREALWVAADWAVALAAQALAALLFYWFFRSAWRVNRHARPGWLRVVALVLAAPFLISALNVAYLVAIPSVFLIEGDNAVEVSTWKEECAVPGASLTKVRSPVDTPLEAAGQALVRPGSGGYALLQARSFHSGPAAPGCGLTMFHLPAAANSGPAFVLPGGAFLSQHWSDKGPDKGRDKGRDKAQQFDWFYGSGPAAEPSPIRPPAGYSNLDGGPILSSDGEWVAWIVRIPGSGQPPLAQVTLRALNGDGSATVPLRGLGLGTYLLLKADMRSKEIVVSRNMQEFYGLALEGGVRWRMRPENVEAQPQTFIRIGEGWVAWDAYQERDAYRIAWSLAKGSGLHRVPKGRGITSAAVDAAGAYIALSVTGSYSIGSVRDAVSVLRVSDGAEVFRKYLPRYTRSEVAFPGRFFAYTDFDGRATTVRLLRLP